MANILILNHIIPYIPYIISQFSLDFPWKPPSCWDPSPVQNPSSRQRVRQRVLPRREPELREFFNVEINGGTAPWGKNP